MWTNNAAWSTCIRTTAEKLVGIWLDKLGTCQEEIGYKMGAIVNHFINQLYLSFKTNPVFFKCVKLHHYDNHCCGVNDNITYSVDICQKMSDNLRSSSGSVLFCDKFDTYDDKQTWPETTYMWDNKIAR
jgi:hypothetical protein